MLTLQGRARRRLAGALLAGVLVASAGCDRRGASPAGAPSATPRASDTQALTGEHLVTFAGLVVKVEQLPGWGHAPPRAALAPGDGSSGFTIGPGVLVLDTGRRIAFDRDTPGGNQCLELLSREDWLPVTGTEHPTEGMLRSQGQLASPCAVIGQVDSAGRAAWFAVRRYDDRLHALGIGSITTYSARDRLATAMGGASFRVADPVRVGCFGQTRSLTEVLSRHLPHVAYVSPRTGTITAVECLGRD